MVQKAVNMNIQKKRDDVRRHPNGLNWVKEGQLNIGRMRDELAPFRHTKIVRQIASRRPRKEQSTQGQQELGVPAP